MYLQYSCVFMKSKIDLDQKFVCNNGITDFDFAVSS